MDTRVLIDRFLAGRRLAVVGVSRNPQELSRMVVAELRKKGYEVFPVRPELDEVDGIKVYPRVQDIPGGVDGAIVMTPPAVTERIVRDCAEAKVPLVWLHRGAGVGAVSEEAVRLCQEKGIGVIPGECPLMFLGGSVHDWHRSMRRMTGSLPLGASEQARADRVTKTLLVALVALEVFTAIGAFYGGLAFITDPMGHPMGMAAPGDMPGLRFGSWLVPGIVLLLANGVFPATVALGALTGRKWAVRAHMLTGMVLTGWIAVQVLMLGWIHVLQPMMLSIGVVLFVLGSIYQARKEGSRRRLAMAV